MTIGIVSPFNPLFIKEYLNEENVPFLHNSATAVNTLVKSFLNKGHHVKVFTTCSDISEIKILKGKQVEVYLVPSGLIKSKPSFKHSFLLDSFFVHRRLSQAIDKQVNEIDVLHAHWTYDFAVACLPFVNKVPVFVTVRDWCPYIVSIQKGFANKIAWRIKYGLFKKVMDCSKVHLIANSKYTYDKIVSDYPQKNVNIIFNPIDECYIIERKQKDVSDNFISIAQIVDDPRKNIESLLKAFSIYNKQHEDAKLHIVGGINRNSDTYKRWDREGLLKNVVLFGNMKHAEMMRLMDEMSCLVHPSLEETFGNILLEAMSRCVPCIGGKESGAVHSVLGDGKYGMVCDITKPDEIKDKMELIHDKKYITDITVEATGMLKEMYASTSIGAKHLDLYKSYN